MNWEDETCVGWFPYDSASSDVLDIPYPEMTMPKETASDVQVKKRVTVMSVLFKPGHRKTLVEAADAVSPVLDTFRDYKDPINNVTIVKDEIVEEDAP